MLSYLHVKNIALIDELEIEFNNGLNVITGETGAGKSILVGAINAVLGNKISKDFIRSGENSAHIELVFSNYNPMINVLLETLDIDIETDLVISRKVGDRSVFRINGTLVNKSAVQLLAASLIDIHSQHEHQSLLDEKNHIELLDRFLGQELNDLMDVQKNLYHSYQQVLRDLGQEVLDDSDKQREIDFLEFEINEIEQLNIDVEKDQLLEIEYKKYMKAGESIEALAKAKEWLLSSEPGLGAMNAVESAMRLLQQIQMDESIESFYEQLDGISVQIDSLSSDMVYYVEQLEIDEETLREMAFRIDALNKLRMKHGRQLEDVLEALEEKREKLKQLLDFEQYKKGLEKKRIQIEAEMYKVCEQLTEIRTKGAKKVEKDIERHLLGLNLSDSSFRIHITSKDKVAIDGKDRVIFMISTNVGTPLKPLSQVASGGEVSRIMLAIKSVLADADIIGTMIFDEIDVGISGMTAQLVGERLIDVSRNKQIITITHLPQIAAMAESHYRIQKINHNENALVAVELLNEKDMIEEVARLLSGKKVTDIVRQNAKELKAFAKKYTS